MIELGRREPVDELGGKHSTKQRELLLAQSSDWAFIMRTGRWYLMRCDGRDRTDAFNKLYAEINQGKIDALARKVETMDNIFPEINYRVYRPLQ